MALPDDMAESLFQQLDCRLLCDAGDCPLESITFKGHL